MYGTTILIYLVMNCITGVFDVPASKAQQRAVAKYMKNNYDEIKIRVQKGEREQIKNHAESNGESINSFIKRAIHEAMQRENG